MKKGTANILTILFALLTVVCAISLIIFLLNYQKKDMGQSYVPYEPVPAAEDPNIVFDPPITNTTPTQDEFEKFAETNPYVEVGEDGNLHAVPGENDVVSDTPLGDGHDYMDDFEQPEYNDVVSIMYAENLYSAEDGVTLCEIFGELYNGQEITIFILDVDDTTYYIRVPFDEGKYAVDRYSFNVTPIDSIP